MGPCGVATSLPLSHVRIPHMERSHRELGKVGREPGSLEPGWVPLAAARTASPLHCALGSTYPGCYPTNIRQ